jgi:hypothetical protein
VVAGAEPAANAIAFQTGFRGAGTGDSASLANTESPGSSTSSAPPTTTAAATTVSDPALVIAIETVQVMPAAQL